MRYFSWGFASSLLLVFLLLNGCEDKSTASTVKTIQTTSIDSTFKQSVKKDTVVTVVKPFNPHPQVDTAKYYIGTTEKTGHNDGPNVEKFLKSVQRKKGDAWCAAFVSYCLTANKVSTPVTRSGLARAFISKKSVKIVDVVMGKNSVMPGDLVIWQRGTTINGHIGIVLKWKGTSGSSIEGNTSPSKGSQYEGDGVYLKTRKYEPANYFRITHFTKVQL